MSEEFLQLEPREYLYALGLEFDVDAQLIAIRGILRRNREATAELAAEIERIEEHTQRLRGVRAELAVDAWVDQIHHSVYQDAAHSMAAIGMLAPLVETVFYQSFRGMGNRFYAAGAPAKSHERWRAAHAIQWDCHKHIVGRRSEKNIVRGIIQLSDAVGLTDRLPIDLTSTLSALFGYRNQMFHHGLEWPLEDRERFSKRIQTEGWPWDWFSTAKSDNRPWIFFLSEKFIEHCLDVIDKVLTAIGLFVRDELLPKPTDP